LKLFYLGINISKKKKEIILVHSFHPFEKYAIRVGERIKEISDPSIEVIGFTPKSIGDDFLSQNLTERIKRNWRGATELRNYIKSLYEKPDFVIVLHSTPKSKTGQYVIFYPAWNFRLEKVILEFESYCNKRNIELVGIGDSPANYVGNHSSIIDFNEKSFKNEKVYVLSEEEGVNLTLDFIKWIKKYYIKKS
jgi:hypothetical protein